MENKAWGMGNTPPRMNNATNGRPDSFHYKAKFLPTLSFFFRDTPFLVENDPLFIQVVPQCSLSRNNSCALEPLPPPFRENS